MSGPMSEDQLLVDWIQNELNDAVERHVRETGRPLRYDAEGIAMVNAATQEAIMRMPEAERRRVVDNARHFVINILLQSRR